MSQKYYPEGAKVLVVCANSGHKERCYQAFSGLFEAMYIVAGDSLAGHGFERIIVVDQFGIERRMGTTYALEYFEQLEIKLFVDNHGVKYI